MRNGNELTLQVKPKFIKGKDSLGNQINKKIIGIKVAPLNEEINRLNKAGHTALADKFNKEKQITGQAIKQQKLTIEDLVQIIEFETKDKYFNDAFFSTQYPEYFAKKINEYNEHERRISYIAVDIENILIDDFLKNNFPNVSIKLK